MIDWNEIAFFLVVIGIPVMGGVILGAFQILKGESKQKLGGDLEARIVQQLHQDLKRFEERLEALETILLDRRKAEDYPANETRSHY